LSQRYVHHIGPKLRLYHTTASVFAYIVRLRLTIMVQKSRCRLISRLCEAIVPSTACFSSQTNEEDRFLRKRCAETSPETISLADSCRSRISNQMREDLDERKSACRYIDTLQTPSSYSSKSTVLTQRRFSRPEALVIGEDLHTGSFSPSRSQ
jgi:hypothetical protein